MECQSRPLVEMETFQKRPLVLLRFFQKSRDRWKQRCRQAKSDTKSWRERERDVRKSRDQWRQKAQAHSTQLARLRAENAQLLTALEQGQEPPAAKTLRKSL